MRVMCVRVMCMCDVCVCVCDSEKVEVLAKNKNPNIGCGEKPHVACGTLVRNHGLDNSQRVQSGRTNYCCHSGNTTLCMSNFGQKPWIR